MDLITEMKRFLPDWTQMKIFSIVSLSGVVWTSKDEGLINYVKMILFLILGNFELRNIWSICVSIPSFVDRVKFALDDTLPIDLSLSSFRPIYMSRSFTFDSKEVQKLFTLLENKTIVAVAENYAKKVMI